MTIISKLIDGMVFKGGILAAGVLCMILTKSGHLPRYGYPISYGMASIGLIGLIIKLREVVNENDESDDPNFEERMAEFYRLKPMLEAKLEEQKQLLIEYYRVRRRWKKMDDYEKSSQCFENIISDFEARMELCSPQDEEIVCSIPERRRHNSARDDPRLSYRRRFEFRAMSADRTDERPQIKYYSL